MSLFVQTTPPSAPKTENVRIVALVYAGFLVLMAVGQLYGFEKFIPLLQSFWLPGGAVLATLLAGLIVTLEVFALPFLLRMQLSPLMRWVSMYAGISVACIWIFLSVWANVTDNVLDNIGLLGVKVSLPVGWWAVLLTMALFVLAVWSAWGMWPSSSQKAKAARSRKP